MRRGAGPGLPSLIGRAQAMAYRDVRGQEMQDADWAVIEGQLRSAYQRLKAGIGGS